MLSNLPKATQQRCFGSGAKWMDVAIREPCIRSPPTAFGVYSLCPTQQVTSLLSLNFLIYKTRPRCTLPSPHTCTATSLTDLVKAVGLKAAVPGGSSATKPVPTRPVTTGSPCGHLA